MSNVVEMVPPTRQFECEGYCRVQSIEGASAKAALTKTAQIRMAGNSVCPQVAAALVFANVVGAQRRMAV